MKKIMVKLLSPYGGLIVAGVVLLTSFLNWLIPNLRPLPNSKDLPLGTSFWLAVILFVLLMTLTLFKTYTKTPDRREFLEKLEDSPLAKIVRTVMLIFLFPTLLGLVIGSTKNIWQINFSEPMERQAKTIQEEFQSLTNREIRIDLRNTKKDVEGRERMYSDYDSTQTIAIPQVNTYGAIISAEVVRMTGRPDLIRGTQVRVMKEFVDRYLVQPINPVTMQEMGEPVVLGKNVVKIKTMPRGIEINRGTSHTVPAAVPGVTTWAVTYHDGGWQIPVAGSAKRPSHQFQEARVKAGGKYRLISDEAVLVETWNDWQKQSLKEVLIGTSLTDKPIPASARYQNGKTIITFAAPADGDLTITTPGKNIKYSRWRLVHG